MIGSNIMDISPSQLEGTIPIPPSKSQTLRAILFASLAKGTSTIHDYLHSPDTQKMIQAIESFGAGVKVNSKTLTIEGTGGALRSPSQTIDCGNSGITLRFISALASLLPTPTSLTGDASIQSLRPMQPLLDALNDLGAKAVSLKGNGFAPLQIQGPLLKNKTSIIGEDSQFVSGLLIAASLAPHPLSFTVESPGEIPWVALTLHWFDKLGIPYQNTDFKSYSLPGSATIEPFTYRVPGDFSTAAFPIGAAISTNSSLTLSGLDFTDPQGDAQIIPILKKMGTQIKTEGSLLHIASAHELQGTSIDCNPIIDALPILSVIACFAKSPTHIFNAKSARHKESDRIQAITQELQKMGAKIEELEDGVIVHPSDLHGAHLDSHHDHRIALALAVAALGAKGKSTLEHADVIQKTYPSFISDFQRIGAKLR